MKLTKDQRLYKHPLEEVHPLSEWDKYHTFIKEQPPYYQPDHILGAYCGSLAKISVSQIIPSELSYVREYAKFLKKQITTVKRQDFLNTVAAFTMNYDTEQLENHIVQKGKRTMLTFMGSVADDFGKRHCSSSCDSHDRLDDKQKDDTELSVPGDYVDEKFRELDDIDGDGTLNEEIEVEPSFVLKLRAVLECAKSKNEFDKELAIHGIIRLSSRTTLPEPSLMRAKVKKILTTQERGQLQDILSPPIATLQELRNRIDALEISTATERLVKRLYDLFCSGLEGRGELSMAMEERQFTVKYLQPLIDWAFQDVTNCESFWCEKGNRDLITSRESEHNFWDGVYCDESTIFSEKPHSGLVEVSGGTEGCSESKLKKDLLKIARGMKKHLRRVAKAVSGIDLEQCRKLKVVAAHVIGNRLYMQAMCCVGKGLLIMWEWADDILPRSLEDMGSFSKTIHSVLVFKHVFLETRRLVKDMKKYEARLSESSMKSGFSSPIRDSDSPWKEWF